MDYDVVVIDSPNQISPIMENAIYITDLFVVPFDGVPSVYSYGNFLKLLLAHRGNRNDFQMLHVLSNLKWKGLRKLVIETMDKEKITRAKTEMRSCGWLAKISENGVSIFDYRPKSKGAEDALALVDEILTLIPINISKS